LTHTITLAATRNRIPHWFTEALATRQQSSSHRSFRWMVLLSRALRQDKLFALENIDWAFVRPKRPGDREVAYAQSQWMVDFIVARHGYESIPKMLTLFRQGMAQSTVLKEVCGVRQDTFVEHFRTWAAQQVQTWGLPIDPVRPIDQLQAAAKTSPEDPEALAALAEGLLYDGQMLKANAAAQRALKLDAQSVLALTVRCTLLMESWRQVRGRADRKKLAGEAEPLLQRLARLDAGNLVAPRYMAQLAMAREDLNAAKPWLERLRRVSPHDPVACQGFAALCLQQGQVAEAVKELVTLAVSNESDPELPLRVADLYARLGRETETASWLVRALRIDPYDAETHEQLAALSLKLERTDDAIDEYRALCHLQPAQSKHFARLALLYKRTGQLDAARQAARRAVELDPDSPVRALLAPAE
jgi:tetratricopeptide (TPR) repeat protein